MASKILSQLGQSIITSFSLGGSWFYVALLRSSRLNGVKNIPFIMTALGLLFVLAYIHSLQ
jgi:hypothetical protein